MAHNEAGGVKLPRVEKHPAFAVDVNTIETLASAVSPSARDLVHLLTYTGLPWGEAAALQAGDVDLTRRRIHVVRTFVELGGTLTTGTPKTNRTRHVPITAPLVPMLERRIENLSRTGLIFTSPNGGPWRNSNFRRDSNWDEATRYAGISGFRVHDLRHTAASLMIESGATVVDVAAVLGHASSHTTLTIYAHLIGARLDDVADRLATRIETACGQNVATEPFESRNGISPRGRN